MRIVVTGPTGFVGRCVVPALVKAGHEVIAPTRSIPEQRGATDSIDWRTIGSLEANIDWSSVLSGADAIVHLAGIAHIVDQSGSALGPRYRAVNCEATLALARAAITAGVKRFVFMSSMRVHGNARSGTVFREADSCRPSDDYGRSKLAAEEGLRRLAPDLEVVNLRPPLIYGPGVRANFLRMLQWVDRGVPLPLGAVANRRSLLYVENLAAAILLSLTHPSAAGETFLVSDGEDLSTPALIRRIALALGKAPRLLPIPRKVLRFGLGLIGRGADYYRLCGDAALDSAHIVRTLAFKPPFTLAEGLTETVRWYQQAHARR